LLPSGSVQLPLASLAGLLEVLMATQIGQDSRLFTLFLETTQGALEGLAFFDPDAGQKNTPPHYGKKSHDGVCLEERQWWQA
jgi:hypothetical protein